MRKILISIVLVLILIGTGFVMIKGIPSINVYGFKSIATKNEEVDNKNANLSNLISITYETNKKELKDAANKLIDKKTEYENQAILAATSSTTSYALKTEEYDIDYLWTKLGNYAKEENVVIKIELTANASNSSYYDLNFTATGSYVGITDFIYDIENDTNLGFKIEEFEMGMSGEELTATFSCKDIAVKVGRIDASTTQENADTSSNTTNTTNSTTTNTTNTTNSTNTNSTTNTTDNS